MVPRPHKPDLIRSSDSEEVVKIPNPGVKEILYENYYYDVTEFIWRHPGGRVMDYYTHPGEDATIAIQQFHNRSTKKVLSIMTSLKRRPATEKELARISPRHKALNVDFTKLHKELLDEGMYNPSIPVVIARLAEIVILGSVGVYFVHSEISYARIFGLFCLTMFFGRGSYLVHEVGHVAFTGSSKVDKIIQQVVSGISNGLSGSWWTRSLIKLTMTSQHSRHHAMPQRLSRDIDLETLPLLAFNKAVVRDPKQGHSFFIKYQVYLFFIIDTFLVASLWKFYLHPRHSIKRRNYIELAFMTTHYIFLLTILGFYDYALIMFFSSSFLLGNFSLSHSHMPVTNDALHWVEFALCHTTNVSQSVFCDWWMGYLNLQIEHHLFPTLPNFRLHKVVPRVKALAAKHNIPYKCVPYYRAVIQSFSNLHQVGKELNH